MCAEGGELPERRVHKGVAHARGDPSAGGAAGLWSVEHVKELVAWVRRRELRDDPVAKGVDDCARCPTHKGAPLGPSVRVLARRKGDYSLVVPHWASAVLHRDREKSAEREVYRIILQSEDRERRRRQQGAHMENQAAVVGLE